MKVYVLPSRDAKFLQNPSPSPDKHRTKSGGPSIEPRYYFSSTTLSLARNTQYIAIAFPEPSISPAPLVRVPQKAQPGLNFVPGRKAGPELCISSPRFSPVFY